MAYHRGNKCVMCELFEICHSIKRCKHGIAKEQQSVVSSNLQWRQWHEEWEKTFSMELLERNCFAIETIVQLRKPQELEQEMRAFKQIQCSKFLELDLKVDYVVSLVSHLSDFIKFPREVSQCPSASKFSASMVPQRMNA